MSNLRLLNYDNKHYSTTRRSQSRSRSRRSRFRINRSIRSEQNSRSGDSAVQGAENHFERLGVDDTAGHGDTQGSNLSQFKRILWDQQETIEELLQEQKNELCQKNNPENKHKFNNRVLGKQHEVNEGFLDLTKKIQKCLGKQQLYQAKSLVDELLNEIECHSEDLVVADLSRNGWLTVQRLRNRCSLPSNLLKKLEKFDDEIDNRKKKGSFERRDNFRERDYGERRKYEDR